MSVAANPPSIIKNLLANRETKRKLWEEQFNTNVIAVASKISDSITANLVKGVETEIINSYDVLPTLQAPTNIPYVFDVSSPTQIERLKKWTEATSQLAPFNEWFTVLSRTTSVEDAEVKDTLYFQTYMNRLATIVHDKIQKNLAHFETLPSYDGIKFSAVWIEFNQDSYPIHTINVKIWIDSSLLSSEQSSLPFGLGKIFS